MKRVCAWCNETMAEGAPDAPISHGICPACMAFVDEDPIPFDTFLDRLGAPVIVVDGDGAVLAVSAEAAAGRDRASLVGRRGGDVLECAWARHPGGCGAQEHCKACTIRNAVHATLADGRARVGVTSYHDIWTPDGEVRRRVTISTEKVNGVVLVRLEE